MGLIEQWYVCEVCGRIGVITQDFDPHYECRPGWTHGRLTKVDMESPVLQQARGAVEALEACRRERDELGDRLKRASANAEAAEAELDRLRGGR